MESWKKDVLLVLGNYCKCRSDRIHYIDFLLSRVDELDKRNFLKNYLQLELKANEEQQSRVR